MGRRLRDEALAKVGVLSQRCDSKKPKQLGGEKGGNGHQMRKKGFPGEAYDQEENAKYYGQTLRDAWTTLAEKKKRCEIEDFKNQ